MSYNGSAAAALSADACNGLTLGGDGGLFAAPKPQIFSVGGTTAAVVLNDAAIAIGGRQRVAPRIDVSLTNPSACDSLLAQITFFMGLSEIITTDGNIWQWGIGERVNLASAAGALSDARVRFFGQVTTPAPAASALRDSSRVLVNQDVQLIPPGGTLYVSGDVYFETQNYLSNALNIFTSQGLSIQILAWGI